MKKKFIATAALSFLAVSAHSFAETSASDEKEMVKCYGVSKKGENDCGDKLNHHGCAGQSSVACNPCEWVVLDKKDCLEKGGNETGEHCTEEAVKNAPAEGFCKK